MLIITLTIIIIIVNNAHKRIISIMFIVNWILY